MIKSAFIETGLETLKLRTSSRRASVTDFWQFLGFYFFILIFILLIFLFISSTFFSIVSVIFNILVFLFIIFAIILRLLHISIFIRRLHDFNRSGWWFFLSFVPLINIILFVCILFIPGNSEENRFGKPSEPKPLQLLDMVLLVILILIILLAIGIFVK